VVGFALGGFIGAAAGTVIGGALSGDHSSSTLPLIIPICETCLSKIDNQLKKINDPNTAIITTPYFTREIEEGFIVITFSNTDYAGQFHKLNKGLVFTSLAEAISQELRSQAPTSSAEQEDSQLLLDMLLPNMPDRNWYRQPDIPPKKLNNAIASYAKNITPESVIGLADGSVMGSAKDGCILTSEGIYYKSTLSRGQFFWRGIQKAHLKNKSTMELVLISGKTATIDCVCLDKIMSILAEYVNKMVILTHAKESSSTDKDKPKQESLVSLMDKYLPNMPDEHWYRQPDIPPKKLKNAISTYANSITPEQVLGLADGTLFGSAKEGCLLTSDGMYFKTSLGQGQVFWKDIQKVNANKNLLEFVLASGKTANIECFGYYSMAAALPEFITQMTTLTTTTE